MNFSEFEKGFEGLIHRIEGKGAEHMDPTTAGALVVDATTPAPPPAKVNAGQLIDTILHDVIYGGILAASIFVKNPQSQQKAATIMQAVQSLLSFLDPQLTGQK